MKVRRHSFTNVLATLTLLLAASPGARATDSPTSTGGASEAVERGRYLAQISGCHDCHTPGGLHGRPDLTRALSGSEVGWRGPWGVTYGSNLTPDDETGLGRWTTEEVARAIRTGFRPDGTILLPPMPWPNFAHMTDEDALAIATYLRQLPPVRHEEPARRGPGEAAEGAVVEMPAPPAWDVPPAATN